jgi:hypothetical protein
MQLQRAQPKRGQGHMMLMTVLLKVTILNVETVTVVVMAVVLVTVSEIETETETEMANMTASAEIVGSAAALEVVEIAPTTAIRHQPHEAMQAATEAEEGVRVATMIAATHVVIGEEMVTTIEEADVVVAHVHAHAHHIAVIDLEMSANIVIGTATTAIVVIVLIDNPASIIEEKMRAVRKPPSVRVHHNLMKMNGIDALSLSSSLQPASVHVS